MSSTFGIELINPTSNTVVVDLFQLGASNSSKIYNGVLAQSITINDILITSPVDGGLSYWFNGNSSEIDANIDTYYNVSVNDVYLSQNTSTVFNPLAVRQIVYSDASTDNVLLGQVVPPVSLKDFTDEIVSLFETKVGQTGVISINAIPKVKKGEFGNYYLNLKFNINYLVSEGYIASNPSFVTLQQINIEGSIITNFDIPINGFSLYPELWNRAYINQLGVTVRETTGDSYGELINEQIGSPKTINSIDIRPLESSNYDEGNRISQLLQSLKWKRIDSNGEQNTFVLNPAVDKYQSLTNLRYVNIGEKTFDFPLDGRTVLTYQLLPYASVNFIFYYVEISNWIVKNKDLIREVVKLNKSEIAKVQELSKYGKTFRL